MIRSQWSRQEIITNKNYPGANRVINAVLGENDFSHIPEHIMTAATQRGSDVHDAIESFILHGTPLDESYPLEYDIYFSNFMKWYNKYKPEFIAAELPFIHDDRGYKGIIDCVCKIDGKVVVIDWKTSTSLDKFRARLQQGLYTLALKEVFGIEVDEVRVLSINRSGFKYYNFNYSDDEVFALLKLKQVKEETQ